jgi:hypothetical protein
VIEKDVYRPHEIVHDKKVVRINAYCSLVKLLCMVA